MKILLILSRYFLFFFSILFISKIVFYSLWSHNLVNASAQEFFHSFILGLRFNAQVASYFSILPLLMDFLLKLTHNNHFLKNDQFKYLKRFLSITSGVLFVFLFFCLIFLEISFHSFYFYFQTILNELFFGLIEDDTKAVLTSINKNFPLVAIILLIMVTSALLFYFHQKKSHHYINQLEKTPRSNLNFFLFIIILAMIARGSFSTFPLSTQYNSPPSENIVLQDSVYNGAIALRHAIKIRFLTKKGKSYQNLFQLTSLADAKNNFDQLFAQTINSKIPLLYGEDPYPEQIKMQPHVVAVLAESLGLTLFKYHHPKNFPILNQLPNFFPEQKFSDMPGMISADNGTIGTLISFITGLTHRIGQISLSESHSQIQVPNPDIDQWKKWGYEIHFIYGGSMDWRKLRPFLTTQKIDQLHDQFSITNYFSNQKIKIESSEWGVHDHYLFNYTEQLIQNDFNKIIKSKSKPKPKPKLIFILTTTNHPPFEIPQKSPKFNYPLPSSLKMRLQLENQDQFKERLKSFHYSTTSISSFLKNIQNLKDNTHVVITGDHNFWGHINYSEQQTLERYSVPLLFFQFNQKKMPIAIPQSHEQVLGFMTEYLMMINDIKPLKNFYRKNENLLRYLGMGINPQILSNQKINEKTQMSIKDFIPWRQLTKNNLNSKKISSEQKEIIKIYGQTLWQTDDFIKNLK